MQWSCHFCRAGVPPACVSGRHNTYIMLKCQVLFLTTALSFVARASWSSPISTMARSVVFSRWDLVSYRETRTLNAGKSTGSYCRKETVSCLPKSSESSEYVDAISMFQAFREPLSRDTFNSSKLNLRNIMLSSADL